MKISTHPYDEVGMKINHMMAHENGIKEIFYDKKDRLVCSQAAILISVDNNDVGFLNVVNQGLENILFIDQGIIEKYRGKGYGREALQKLLDSKLFEEYLICETKDNNTLANSSIQKIGKFIFSYDDRNFYLLQKEKYDDFINSEELIQLKNNVKGKRLTR